MMNLAMADYKKLILSKDFLSGLIFTVIAAGLLWEARGYAMGSMLRMGPGFFPVIISSLLGLMGIAILVKATLEGARERPVFAPMPALLITLALLAFAFSLQRLGLVIATLLLVTLTRLAMRPFNLIGTLLLSGVLVLLSLVVFGYFLRLPLRLWP